jgi:steroid 5-alpha reductase family enzyme
MLAPVMRGRFAIIGLAYVMALAVAVAVGAALPGRSPLEVAWWADVAATLAVFAFSFTFRNTSFYDPYWSVAPLFIGLYWLAVSSAAIDPLRATLSLSLVALWGARLTFNWARGWPALDHEDWRYSDMHEQLGSALYWPVSLLGLHGMPTVLVFLGCLPLYVALSLGTRPFGVLDVLATAVTLGAIALEAVADKQLHRFRTGNPAPGEVLRTGLWAWTRHPNYLGEVLFWWGIFLFGVAASPSHWWTGVGAVLITLLFRFISLRLIETRMLERRPDFARVQQEIPLLWPRRPRAPLPPEAS